jgi:ankyrin repeat protein
MLTGAWKHWSKPSSPGIRTRSPHCSTRGSPDSRDEGSTPLYTAAAQGEQALARLLLAAGADPNLRSGDEAEGTPL